MNNETKNKMENQVNNNVEHILGIVASKAYNMEEKREDYSLKIKVSDEILQFMNRHDVKVSATGSRIYVYNQIEYIYLGIYSKELNELSKKEVSEAK